MRQMLILVATCTVLSSLESLIPLMRFRRRSVVPNLALTAMVFAINLALSFGIAFVSAFAVAHRRFDAPAWLMLVAGIASFDLSTYVAHVALHKLPAGWRVHRVHHSDAAVDVTTAFRQHPAETVWRILWQLPAIVILGLPLSIVATYLTISGVNALLEHANIRVHERFDRLARLVFVTPAMHKVHHSRVQQETDTNYANIFSLWDRLFGTYTRRTDFATLRYGLD